MIFTQMRLASLCTTNDILHSAINGSFLSTSIHLSFTDALGGYKALLFPGNTSEEGGWSEYEDSMDGKERVLCSEEFNAGTFDPRRTRVSRFVTSILAKCIMYIITWCMQGGGREGEDRRGEAGRGHWDTHDNRKKSRTHDAPNM